MKFSVVIPAFNEAKRIQHTIKILSQQTVGRKNFEIVVVDNKSLDGTARLAKAAGADIVISEKLKGTNFARQKGVEVSHGTIVAFLDADCEPRKDWLQRIEYNLRQPGVAAVSGPYDYGFTGLTRFSANLFTNVFFPLLPHILFLIFGRRAGVMIGGNFAAYRTSIEKIGGLPRLAFWGDDAAAAMLFSRHVGRVVFDTKLIVDSSPRRFEKEGMFKLQKKYSQAYLNVYFSKDYE